MHRQKCLASWPDRQKCAPRVSCFTTHNGARRQQPQQQQEVGQTKGTATSANASVAGCSITTAAMLLRKEVVAEGLVRGNNNSNCNHSSHKDKDDGGSARGAATAATAAVLVAAEVFTGATTR